MYQVPYLPLQVNFDTKNILKKLIKAHKTLAELKGTAKIIPNQNILISTLSLQEAQSSAAIESIITTQDELYKSYQEKKEFTTQSAKEIYKYVEALKHGYKQVLELGLLTNRTILEVQSIIEENTAGFRSIPGTELKSNHNQKVVYTPPQTIQEIQGLMRNLEEYINDDSLCDKDPLLKMAIIHHQFESIHPFYDGNGRTGRILNILFMIKNNLLTTPILYLSRYINQNKADYYRLLQGVREETETWEDWVLFMLDAVIESSQDATELINGIHKLFQYYKDSIRRDASKVYSQSLLNNLFQYPYTKASFLAETLNVHKNTARRYLETLVDLKLLEKMKLERDTFYINGALFDLLEGRGRM